MGYQIGVAVSSPTVLAHLTQKMSVSAFSLDTETPFFIFAIGATKHIYWEHYTPERGWCRHSSIFFLLSPAPVLADVTHAHLITSGTLLFLALVLKR